MTALAQRLAQLYGLETGYRDTEGRWQEAATSTLIAVLRALGAELPPETDLLAAEQGGVRPRGTPATPEVYARQIRGLEHALEARARELSGRLVEPVLPMWGGRAESLQLRLPGGHRHQGAGNALGGGRRDKARLTLTLEDGTISAVEIAPADHEARLALEGLGPSTLVIPPEVWTGRLSMERSPSAGGSSTYLPFGYHRLVIENADRVDEALIIAAPKQCFPASGSLPAGAWGVFAPLYALRSERDWGAGDLAELEGMLSGVKAAGGSVVATLPLLASYLDVPFEPAPYRPVSRIFWNEFYLAPERLPGFAECVAALRLWESTGLQNRISALRERPWVDYRETMALKRAVLEELAAAFFASGRDGSEPSYRKFLEGHGEAAGYAEFRERVELEGEDWRGWSGERSAQRAERSTDRDKDPRAERISPREYHLYCQWRMEEEIAALAAADASAGLFLDLPVGTHPGGYDTWRWRDMFVRELSTGAPPDSFFLGGQDWAFPPLHPDAGRRSGHGYFVACLRHHMRHASVLRVDHMMGLHRLYVIPAGESATEGVYLRYPADELYAVLSLESERMRTVVVGEDLGTVPSGVRAAMRRRRVMRTWVFQLSFKPRAAVPVEDIPSGSVSSLNTHDMVPWAGFLEGRDIEARLETGQITEDEAAREAEERALLRARLTDFLSTVNGLPAVDSVSPGGESEGRRGSSPETLIRAVLQYVAARSDGLMMLNLEDMLLEEEPQNLPGTGAERPNWRRRVAGGMDETLRAVVRAGSWLSR